MIALEIYDYSDLGDKYLHQLSQNAGKLLHTIEDIREYLCTVKAEPIQKKIEAIIEDNQIPASLIP